ncbi:MAG: hypothetical protein IPK33_12750 [Gemmatimonadetes bacterium]|nr:hypothetical protein [Gemmatimonadota bacterium]
MTHAELDARALAVARAIAERLKTDPSLVDQARAYVTSRLALASAGEQHELREWERILRTRSLPNLRRFLVDGGERANAAASDDAVSGGFVGGGAGGDGGGGEGEPSEAPRETRTNAGKRPRSRR